MEQLILNKKTSELVDTIPDIYGKFEGTFKKWEKQPETTKDIVEEIATKNHTIPLVVDT